MNAVNSLKAIAKHAGRVKSGKSHFTVNEHMDAIIKLTNIGLGIDVDTEYENKQSGTGTKVGRN